jgi:hypothetical protein
MKAASKVLLALAMFVAVAVLATARAEEEKKAEPKTVTLKGTICCSKCELGETKKCGNSIKVKEGEKNVVYYFIDKGNKEKYHGKICSAPAPGSVTGLVSKKDGKNFITPAKDGVKYD